MTLNLQTISPCNLPDLQSNFQQIHSLSFEQVFSRKHQVYRYPRINGIGGGGGDDDDEKNDVLIHYDYSCNFSSGAVTSGAAPTANVLKWETFEFCIFSVFSFNDSSS